MGITTTKRRKMNIIESIDNNLFLKKIFPEGIGDALIGQFGLDRGRFSVNIHTHAKPAKETHKWGIWGKNYNVIVIELLGEGLTQIEIQNWDKFESMLIHCDKNEDDITISSGRDDWAFKVCCKSLTFQKCSTYIS
jgi:hypothetical protein